MYRWWEVEKGVLILAYVYWFLVSSLVWVSGRNGLV
jgi:hypothetical protein